MLLLDCEIREIKEITDRKYLVSLTCGRYSLLLEMYKVAYDFTGIHRAKVAIDEDESVCKDGHLCLATKLELKTKQIDKGEEITVFTTNGLSIILKAISPEKIYDKMLIGRTYYISIIQI